MAIILDGIRHLRDWTIAVMEQAAYKFVNPTDIYANRDMPKDATGYEKAVRYNYSASERVALVETLALIYSLQRELLDAAPVMSDFIRYGNWLLGHAWPLYPAVV